MTATTLAPMTAAETTTARIETLEARLDEVQDEMEGVGERLSARGPRDGDRLYAALDRLDDERRAIMEQLAVLRGEDAAEVARRADADALAERFEALADMVERAPSGPRRQALRAERDRVWAAVTCARAALAPALAPALAHV